MARRSIAVPSDEPAIQPRPDAHSAAEILLREHPKDAMLYAASQANESLRKQDNAARRHWLKVMMAIGEMKAAETSSRRTVH